MTIKIIQNAGEEPAMGYFFRDYTDKEKVRED